MPIGRYTKKEDEDKKDFVLTGFNIVPKLFLLSQTVNPDLEIASPEFSLRKIHPNSHYQGTFWVPEMGLDSVENIYKWIITNAHIKWNLDHRDLVDEPETKEDTNEYYMRIISMITLISLYGEHDLPEWILMEKDKLKKFLENYQITTEFNIPQSTDILLNVVLDSERPSERMKFQNLKNTNVGDLVLIELNGKSYRYIVTNLEGKYVVISSEENQSDVRYVYLNENGQIKIYGQENMPCKFTFTQKEEEEERKEEIAIFQQGSLDSLCPNLSYHEINNLRIAYYRDVIFCDFEIKDINGKIHKYKKMDQETYKEILKLIFGNRFKRLNNLDPEDIPREMINSSNESNLYWSENFWVTPTQDIYEITSNKPFKGYRPKQVNLIDNLGWAPFVLGVGSIYDMSYYYVPNGQVKIHQLEKVFKDMFEKWNLESFDSLNTQPLKLKHSLIGKYLRFQYVSFDKDVKSPSTCYKPKNYNLVLKKVN